MKFESKISADLTQHLKVCYQVHCRSLEHRFALQARFSGVNELFACLKYRFLTLYCRFGASQKTTASLTQWGPHQCPWLPWVRMGSVSPAKNHTWPSLSTRKALQVGDYSYSVLESLNCVFATGQCNVSQLPVSLWKVIQSTDQLTSESLSNIVSSNESEEFLSANHSLQFFARSER